MRKITLALAMLLTINVCAQDTYQEVYALFQAKCTIGCHGNGGSAGNLDLYGGGDASVVYNNIVNATPVNPAAAAKGYKRIYPGHPEKSFLLRKCATAAWDSYYPIEMAEGNTMPDGQPALTKEELELIRQWILFGAKETGTQVNTQVIHDFYNGLGKTKIAPLPVPAQGEGFQLRMGPFFLAPLQEVEFFKKQDVNIPDSIEVNTLTTNFNDESHHFIIYKFADGIDQSYPAGLRNINDVGGSSLGISDLIATWQDTMTYALPENTAFKWSGNQVLDLNYHIVNYSQDSILAAECYINIYTDEPGTNAIEMFSQLIPINGVEFILGTGMYGQDLIIPNDGQDHTFTYSFAFPFYPLAPKWYFWSLQSHTHSRGKDFDVYIRNPNGTKGEQIYEGFYNTDYTFNQGYYDWAHPPVKIFDPLLPVHLQTGFIFEAVYQNFTDDTLYWGNTTHDEMMLLYIQYTEQPLTEPSSVGELANPVSFTAYPNPFSDNTQLYVNLPSPDFLQLAIFNIAGEVVATLANGNYAAGNHRFDVSAKSLGLAPGIYLARLISSQGTQTQRLSVVK